MKGKIVHRHEAAHPAAGRPGRIVVWPRTPPPRRIANRWHAGCPAPNRQSGRSGGRPTTRIRTSWLPPRDCRRCPAWPGSGPRPPNKPEPHRPVTAISGRSPSRDGRGSSTSSARSKIKSLTVDGGVERDPHADVDAQPHQRRRQVGGHISQPPDFGQRGQLGRHEQDVHGLSHRKSISGNTLSSSQSVCAVAWCSEGSALASRQTSKRA